MVLTVSPVLAVSTAWSAVVASPVLAVSTVSAAVAPAA
jgi:hypothetical protein